MNPTSPGVVGRMPASPVAQAKGFDNQVRAALYNIENFDKAPHQDIIPEVVLPDGRKIEARFPSETARERGLLYLEKSPEEAVRELERKLPRNAIYALKRPGPAIPGTPRELLVLVVGYDFKKGTAIANCMCLGIPARGHAKGWLGSSTRPLSIPADADFEDVTAEAKAAGSAWAKRTFPYRAWLATLGS